MDGPWIHGGEYLNRLYDLHEVIRGEGRFVSHAQRFLIEASQRH
jgi:hypothetical protein